MLCARLYMSLQWVAYNFHWILNPKRLGINGDLKDSFDSSLSLIPSHIRTNHQACQFVFFFLNCCRSSPFSPCPYPTPSCPYLHGQLKMASSWCPHGVLSLLQSVLQTAAFTYFQISNLIISIPCLQHLMTSR